MTDLEDLKVGDHVALTIKGTVYNGSSEATFIRRNNAKGSFPIMVYPEDTVELIPDQLPIKFGAVIKYRYHSGSDVMFSYNGSKWISKNTGIQYSPGGLTNLYKGFQLDVIFEGTD